MRKILLSVSLFTGTCVSITMLTFCYLQYVMVSGVNENQFIIATILSAMNVFSILMLLILVLIERKPKNETEKDDRTRKSSDE